ncbi:lectin-like protein [Rhodohalobacter sulfatireducens]|uniref:C-type lectin domain-containing protein n=1 Tax=Rhodohalobacter sulfatireducens TaxID=2911366 RepID=A0ABS9K9T2_9BACT|nr:lectin-like protein [Rhodohalobacter sulfatireducens]MCG2587606.1 hypothetical protein [Rhodohalobacter sulfatireducens]
MNNKLKSLKNTVLWILPILLLVAACDQSSLPTNTGDGIQSELGVDALGKSVPEGLVYNEHNGNYYSAIEDLGITWDDANVAAQELSYGKCEAHLATITSQNEQDWIVNTFPNAVEGGYWLGGSQASGSDEPAGGWEWVTGETFFYTNWRLGEPNNANAVDENSIHFLPTIFAGGDGGWNDQNGNSTSFENNGETFYAVEGYVVEYECPTKVTGGGQVIRVVTGNGDIQKRIYGFNAQKGGDLVVKGQAQSSLQNPDGSKISFHMESTCLSVWGNNAWIGTRVTQSSDESIIPTGITFLWRIVDNGQGKNADDDLVGFYATESNPGTGEDLNLASFCTLQPTEDVFGPAFGASLVVGKGNFQIH